MKPMRIAVFRALQLGDMLCLVPALRALRHAYPGAEITLISLPWASDFARRFECYVDRFEAFPGMSGFPEQGADEAGLPGFLDSMRARRFDLFLQCHGSGQLSNALMKRIGAARIAGFHPAGQDAPDAARFIAWDEDRNEVLRFLDLLRHIGVPDYGEQLELPLQERDFADLREAAPALPPAGAYVCVHPGARFASRRWPVQRFAAVAARAAREGLQVVITGSQAETQLCGELAAQLRVPALNLAGKTSLGALAALVAGARLVVCNDTGMSHVAAALATPSVVISSGSNVRRWAPLNASRHRVLHAELQCRPCMHAECPLAGHPCASAITAEHAWNAAQAMLWAQAQKENA